MLQLLLLINWAVLGSLGSLLFGSSTLITFVLYRKQQKRLRTAEAFSKEVEALKSTIDTMQQQLQYYAGRLAEMQKFYDGRLAEMQNLIIGKDSYISQVSQDKHLLEIKNAKNKSAINKAYSCRCRSDTYKCPVLIQRTENEEEYLKILNNNQKS